jgi:hypothetical protein
MSGVELVSILSVENLKDDDHDSSFDSLSRLTLEPTQPPIQCVLGGSFPGSKAIGV